MNGFWVSMGYYLTDIGENSQRFFADANAERMIFVNEHGATGI